MLQFSKPVVFLAIIVLASSESLKNKAKNKAKEVANKIKRDSTLKNETSGDYCFSKNYGLDGPLNKALVFAPMSPNEMDVKFLLFTCNNVDKSQNFSYLSDSSEWKNSNFDPNAITRFIVHGWIEKYPGNSAGYNWMEQMKNLILKRACVNVIAIDWSIPARSIYYYQSAANTPVVGRMIGCVINKLKADLNLNPENVHLIGHSLGGQVVGYAGKNVTNPKVAQITGLDPASPGFQSLPENYKLALTDGKCVNVIHTNGARTLPLIDGLGTLVPLGNADFYPNGGHSQPGCGAADAAESFFKDLFTAPSKAASGISDAVLCSHVRSVRYGIGDQNYTDTNTCQLVGYTCSSYDDFNLGKCGDSGTDGKGAKLMPLNLDYWDDTNNCDSNAVHIQYYLNTGDIETPQEYCLYHYQIIVSIKDQLNPCLGDITIKLSNGKQIEVKLGLNNKLDSNDGNKRFTKLFTDSKELPKFNGADVTSTASSSCLVNQIEFKYMSSIDDSVRKAKSMTVCSTDGKTFADKC